MIKVPSPKISLSPRKQRYVVNHFHVHQSEVLYFFAATTRCRRQEQQCSAGAAAVLDIMHAACSCVCAIPRHDRLRDVVPVWAELQFDGQYGLFLLLLVGLYAPGSGSFWLGL